MNITHWVYFLSIEKDVEVLSRYIEFNNANYSCYSTQNARLLMSTAQEVDSLFKQICAKLGNSSSNEGGYREFILKEYPRITTAEVEIPMYDLKFTPYKDWANNKTPSWWTANNKVKHHRHTHFAHASVKNLLNAVAGLFIANLYFYSEVEGDIRVFPGTSFFLVSTLTSSVSPTILGTIPNFKLP